jgi:serine phosphatase RsbU (regulator of sigma subunit)
MERGAPADALSWLVLPAAAVLVLSALTLPSQPHTGLSLRGDVVGWVLPQGPGAAAGLAPGDRLARADERPSILSTLRSPLAGARPGVPFQVRREREGRIDTVTLSPAPLPAGERRMRAALLAVAAGFALLGGWVWSERRDRLTRPFYALTLAFACLLTPLPAFDRLAGAAVLEIAFQVLFVAVQLVLPALCIHFFVLFPDPHAARRRLGAGVAIAYGTASLLFVGSIGALALRTQAPGLALPVLEVLQAAAALWFAAGLLIALLLFARSFRRAGSADARRRLRVAWIGTTLGLAPLAAVIAIHLGPRASLPGERASVLATLLVPLSFSYAIAVHRVFDFRLALRAAAAALVVAALLAVAFLGVEAAILAWGSPTSLLDARGAALAVVVLGATLAGTARPWAAALARGLVPLREGPSLHERLAREPAAAEGDGGLLERAASVVALHLRLDRCQAVARASGDGAHAIDPALALGPGFWAALGGHAEPLAVEDLHLGSADRDALEAAQAHWVLPVPPPGRDATEPVAALMLGRRLAGPWLDRRETQELAGFAGQLAVALENATLRRMARSHGALGRELEQAHAIQMHLLPRRAPVYPTLDCAAATLSGEAVGGDYYDFFQRSDREFLLVVGDAAGKGVPAALLAAGIQARFRHEAQREHDPARVLEALNRELVHFDQPAKFVGLLCARVEVRPARLRFANAGLTPPLLRRRDGAFEEVTTGGMLLGVQAGSQYPEAAIELGAGDLALIYTDGLVEARRGDELFGLERVRAVLEREAHRRARDVLQCLVGAVAAFADGPPDDLTVLVLKQLADPVAEEPPVRTAIPLKRRTASADLVG